MSAGGTNTIDAVQRLVQFDVAASHIAAGKQEMRDRGMAIVLWTVSVAAGLCLFAAGLALGEANLDEGWYLYAARMVSRGRLPFVDFAFTQGPVMPFAYSVAMPMVRAWGVLGGRIFTAVLGLGACLCAALLAARLAGKECRGTAAWISATLVLVNACQASFFTLVKTYSLASIFVTGGFLAFACAAVSRKTWLAALGGILLGAASCVRLSAAAVPLVVLAFVAWRALAAGRRDPGLGRVCLAAAISTAAAILAGFLPFVLKSPEGLKFGLLEYHAGRSAGGLLPAIAYKAGFASRLVQDYFAAFCLAAVVACHEVVRRSEKAACGGCAESSPCQDESRAIRVAGWLAVLGVTAVHIAAPFPYDDYQTFIYPLAAALLGAEAAIRMASVARIAGTGDGVRRRAESAALTLVLLVCAGAAFSSPVTHSWFVGQRDRLWWPLREESSLRRLRRAAEVVRGLCGPDRLVLTQDTYLAVEAGLDVPEGMEMGPFSYFPDWPREKAEKLHVLNREMMREVLRTSQASVAALSGYGLAVRAPEIVELSAEEQRALRGIIEERYRLAQRIGRFGHAETTLEIYQRR